MTILEEGLQGKVLLHTPEGREAGIRLVSTSAYAVYECGNDNAAHPNFMHILPRITASAPGGAPLMKYLEMTKLQEAR